MAAQSFPTEAQRSRMVELKKWKRLYDGEHYLVFGVKDYFVDDQKKEKKLYITANLCALITDYFADMEVGEGLVYSIDDDKAQTQLDEIVEANGLDELLFDIAQDQSRYGQGVFRVRREKGETEEASTAVFEDIEPSEYFPEYDSRDRRKRNPVKVTLVSWITDPTGKEKYGLMYKTIYERVGKVVTVRYEVRAANADMTEGINLVGKLDYASFYPEMADAPLVLDGTERIPVWEVNNVRDSSKNAGKSDYKDVEGLIDEINNRLTHVSVQLIKHLNAKLAVPAGANSDEEGEEAVQRTHEIDVIEVEEGDPMPQYISNANSMLEQAFKYTDKLMLITLGIAKVPPELLNIEGAAAAGNLKVEAMRIRLFPSMRKTHRKQTALRYAVEQALAYALALEGVATDKKVNVEFDDVVPVDMNSLVNQVVARKTASLISTQTALQEMDGIGEEEAMEEIARIKAEEPVIEPFNEVPEV